MRRSAFGPILVCLLLVGTTPAFGLDPSTPIDVFGFTATVSGVDSAAALAGVSSDAPGAAMGQIVADQRAVGGRVEDHNVSRQTLFENSGLDNRGILSINQDAGNLSNQANVRVLAVLQSGPQVQSLDLNAAASATDNTVIVSGGQRENRIVGSFGGTVGIVGINQSTGNINNQANLLVLALGVTSSPEFLVVPDITLGEVKTRNAISDDGTGSRSDVVTDSFARFRGIAQVSQSSGDVNIVRNTMGISVTIVTDGLNLSLTAGGAR